MKPHIILLQYRLWKRRYNWSHVGSHPVELVLVLKASSGKEMCFSFVWLCDYCNEEEKSSSSTYRSESGQCHSKEERNLMQCVQTTFFFTSSWLKVPQILWRAPVFLHLPEIHAVCERRHRWSSAASPESGGEAECSVTSLNIHAFVYCFLSLTPSRPDSSSQRTDGDLCPAVLLVIPPPESQHLLPNK